jgi:hypothetical protein
MKQLIYIFCLLFFSALGFAQEVSFTASVNKNVVGLDESFTLTFKLNAGGNKFKAPVLSDNFKIYSGPNQSTSMSYINGRMSTSISYQYLLVPINVGKYVIEPATIEVDGESYSSNPIEIEVVEEKQPQTRAKQKSPGNQSNTAPKEQNQTDIGDNLFLRLSVNKKEATPGEQIVASYKLYNRLDLVNISGQKLPDFVGFYTDDVEVDPNTNASREVIDGVIYQVFLLKRTTLFPQRTGELELRPLEITATVREREATPVNTFFGPRYQYKQRNVPLKSNGIIIKVQDPPGKKPASFSGAVGALKLKATVDNTTVPVNGAINLKYTISGTGNLKLIDLPEVDFPVDFEVYDPKITSTVQNPNGMVSGSKTFEYLIIPRVPGSFDIPEITLPYYNPTTKKYESTNAKGFTIEVVDDGSAASQEAARIKQKRDIKQIGKDIRFIKTEFTDLSQKGNSFYGSVWFVLAYLIPAILAAAVYIALRRYHSLQSDKVGLRKRRAGKLASKQLKKARELLQQQNTSAFYEELSGALTAYLSGKFSIGMADMNKQRIKEEMQQTHISDELTQRTITLLEDCEMARYAPGAQGASEQAYSEAEYIIESLEKALS